MLGLFQARGERRLTRTRGIWILRTPFINQPSAHLDQIYALSGTLVIGDGPSQLFLESCAIVNVLVYIQFFVCMRRVKCWLMPPVCAVTLADKSRVTSLRVPSSFPLTSSSLLRLFSPDSSHHSGVVSLSAERVERRARCGIESGNERSGIDLRCLS